MKKFELGYGYAANGNLTGKTIYDPDSGRAQDVWSYAYANHAATGVSASAGQRFAMQYDAAGNMVSQRDYVKNLSKAMAYDSSNRVRAVTNADNGLLIGSYRYDDQGFRVHKVARFQNGGDDYTAELFYPSMYFCVEQKVSPGGREVPGTGYGVSNIYLNGVRIAAALPDGSAQYYLTDQVDSVKVVVDDAGLVQSRMEYLPFGETWFQEDRAGFEGKNAPKYNSQELDKESGYYFYNARHYDPEIGRFVTADTLIDGEYSTQGWNRYSYVHNNPVVYKDPTGHEREEIKTSHNNPELKQLRESNAQKDSNKTFDVGNKKISGAQLQQKLQVAKGKQQLFQNKCNEQLSKGLTNLAVNNQEMRNTAATIFVTAVTGLTLGGAAVPAGGFKAAGKALIEAGKDTAKYGGPILAKAANEMVKNAKELVKPVVAAAIANHDKIIQGAKNTLDFLSGFIPGSPPQNKSQVTGWAAGEIDKRTHVTEKIKEGLKEIIK